jgi:hypothetical protein
MGRCLPLMDYKRNFVHQTRNKFFRSRLWMKEIAVVSQIFVSELSTQLYRHFHGKGTRQLSRLTLQLAAASSISSLTESRMPGKVARSTCCWPSRSTRFRCIGLARESETVESTIPVECEALKNTEPHILPACRRFSSCIPRTAASRTARASKTVMAGFWNRADHRPIFVLVEGTRI